MQHSSDVTAGKNAAQGQGGKKICSESGLYTLLAHDLSGADQGGGRDSIITLLVYTFAERFFKEKRKKEKNFGGCW